MKVKVHRHELISFPNYPFPESFISKIVSFVLYILCLKMAKHIKSEKKITKKNKYEKILKASLKKKKRRLRKPKSTFTYKRDVTVSVVTSPKRQRQEATHFHFFPKFFSISVWKTKTLQE